MPEPIRLAFLGCGFITRVHSQHLRSVPAGHHVAYASRDRGRAEEYCRRYQGSASYGEYAAAIDDPRVDAVVIAVPPRFHLDLTLRRWMPASTCWWRSRRFLRMEDFQAVLEARNRADRVVLVGENDHYKPLAVVLRRLLADGAIGEHGVRALHDDRPKAQVRRRLAQRRDDGGRRRVFRGRHPLAAPGRQPRPDDHEHPGLPALRPRGPATGDARAKSMMVAFRYDNDAVGSLYYSREMPSLLRGLRLSKMFGRERRHHVRVERRVRAGPGQRDAAADVPGFPRHSRLSGDVSRLHRGRFANGARPK